jgi:hypothetical protein
MENFIYMKCSSKVMTQTIVYLKIAVLYNFSIINYMRISS